MKDLRLTARITDEDLFFKLQHELGCTFWRVIGNGENEIVYFSGSKIVYYKGRLSQSHAELLKGSAWQVSKIAVDEDDGRVHIEQ